MQAVTVGRIGALPAILAFFLYAVVATQAAVTSIPVLGYHQLDHTGLYSITSSVFTQQMNRLLLLGYTPITPEQYVAWLQGVQTGLPFKPILITFDDNIANAQAATAILKARNFKATMYVVTGFADLPDGWIGLSSPQ